MIRNIIKWSKRVAIEGSNRQSSYYDHFSFKVPFTGTYDKSSMWTAINKKFPPKFTNFGGYTTLSDINLLEPGFIQVDMCYHIGE